eukprot:6478356-Amphidinium_carterae.1
MTHSAPSFRRRTDCGVLRAKGRPAVAPGVQGQSRVLQAGVFLDFSKCYERVPLAQLEQFAIERGFPLYVLNCALNMYRGSRRVLIQGAVGGGLTCCMLS